MRLVEVIPGVRTSPELVTAAPCFVATLGHTAIHAKDTPGFVVNHLGRALPTESLALLSEGVASVARYRPHRPGYGRTEDGSLRADGPDRARRLPPGHGNRVVRVLRRSPPAAVCRVRRPVRRWAAGSQDRRRLLSLSRRRRARHAARDPHRRRRCYSGVRARQGRIRKTVAHQRRPRHRRPLRNVSGGDFPGRRAGLPCRARRGRRPGSHRWHRPVEHRRQTPDRRGTGGPGPRRTTK